MVKETKEERQLRREREAAAEQQALIEFRAGLPKRIFEAQALASTIGVCATVVLTPDGPSVTFSWHEEGDQYSTEETVNYYADEWRIDYIERKLQEIKETQEENKRKLVRAKEIMNGLDDYDKDCLKKYMKAVG